LKSNTTHSKNNATSLKPKYELNQDELVAVRNAVERTLADYYRKKSSISYNVKSEAV
jgi:hypothetical protein